MKYPEQQKMEVSMTDPAASRNLLETRPETLEQVETMLMDWEYLPDKPTPEEQHLVHVETLDKRLCLAEPTAFSGAVVLAFGHGYLWVMEARTAAQTFEQTAPNLLCIKL
jgi:hypothetical protein